MKAIVCHEYGSPDVLKLEEIQTPTVGADEVLVRVHAASVNSWDWDLLRGKPFVVRLLWGLLKPRNKILGADIAGRVEAVGGNVKRFQRGDEVFGDLCACGWGGFAEYVCARENALALKPADTSFEEAAAMPQAAVMALQGIRDYGRTEPGQEVLINGAGGGVGTFAVQIAKSFGAQVTGVDSTRKLDMMRSIGADDVIDYTQEDFGIMYLTQGWWSCIMGLVVGSIGFNPFLRSFTMRELLQFLHHTFGEQPFHNFLVGHLLDRPPLRKLTDPFLGGCHG